MNEMLNERPEKQECGECDCCKRWAWEYNLLVDQKQKLRELYPKYKCQKCGDWFHMPYKFCKCDERNPEPL